MEDEDNIIKNSLNQLSSELSIQDKNSRFFTKKNIIIIVSLSTLIITLIIAIIIIVLSNRLP